MTQGSDDGRTPVALEGRQVEADGRRYSPSAARNRLPIAAALAGCLMPEARVLEIASGTGEHGVAATQLMPGLRWVFSDPDAESRASQTAWRAATRTPSLADGEQDRLEGPLDIDVMRGDWWQAVAGPVDAVVCINMIHIAPWLAAEGLMAGAGSLLQAGAPLVLYGPFARAGQMVESNMAFDASLRSRDPRWGVRDLDAQVLPLAAAHGFRVGAIIDMPANNLFVVLRRIG